MEYPQLSTCAYCSSLLLQSPTIHRGKPSVHLPRILSLRDNNALVVSGQLAELVDTRNEQSELRTDVWTDSGRRPLPDVQGLFPLQTWESLNHVVQAGLESVLKS